MFLQSILQKRLQSLTDEEGFIQTSGVTAKGQTISTYSVPPAADDYLKASQKIGSIKGQMNYKQDQNCFSRWDDPIHNESVTQKIVNEVKQQIDTDVSGCKKPYWNPTVGIVGHPTGDLH